MLIISIIRIKTVGFFFSCFATDKRINPLTVFEKGSQNSSIIFLQQSIFKSENTKKHWLSNGKLRERGKK